MKKKTSWLAGAVLSAALPATAGINTPAIPALYDELYPYYGEFCAVTQIEKNQGYGVVIKGGKGGHGVIYFKGICRDTSAGYPKIKICEPGDPEGGVGVSVNSDYKNVNWVAVDSKELFIRGNLKPRDRLDRESYEAAKSDALARRIFDGIEFHEEVLAKKPAGMNLDDFKAEQTLGTDFALTFGRNAFCSRIPLKKEMLPKVVSFLNGLNEQYLSGDRSYEWSGIEDNCTHVTHNALAAAGIWEEYEINKPVMIQLFNLAVPSNEFVDLAERGNDMKLYDLMAVYQDKELRRSLLDNDWLPTQPGGLIEAISMQKENDIYKKKSEFIFLQFPILSLRERSFNHVLKSPRYQLLEANLRSIHEKYSSALQNKRPLLSYQLPEDGFPMTMENPREFESFYEAFYSHLERGIARIDQLLQRISIASP